MSLSPGRAAARDWYIPANLTLAPAVEPPVAGSRPDGLGLGVTLGERAQSGAFDLDA